MSFFSRKPNPPVPPAASKALGAITTGAPAANKAIAAAPISSGWLMSNKPRNAPNSLGQAQQSPIGKPEEQQAPSNQRFRSFAERYVVERCRDWKETEVDARAWEAILQARSIYNKVKEVGRGVTNDF